MEFLVDTDLTKPPCRNDGDAGFDFFVPFDTTTFRDAFAEKNTGIDWKWTDEGIVVPPHSDVNVPSFVRSKIPKYIALVGKNKSGVATKQKLDVGAQVIDSTYQGIIHLHVTNTSGSEQKVLFGQKLIQYLPLVIEPNEAKVLSTKDVTKNEFYEGVDTERGERGFGEGTGLT
jgi:dUTPase